MRSRVDHTEHEDPASSATFRCSARSSARDERHDPEVEPHPRPHAVHHPRAVRSADRLRAQDAGASGVSRPLLRLRASRTSTSRLTTGSAAIRAPRGHPAVVHGRRRAASALDELDASEGGEGARARASRSRCPPASTRPRRPKWRGRAGGAHGRARAAGNPSSVPRRSTWRLRPARREDREVRAPSHEHGRAAVSRGDSRPSRGRAGRQARRLLRRPAGEGDEPRSISLVNTNVTDETSIARALAAEAQLPLRRQGRPRGDRDRDWRPGSRSRSPSPTASWSRRRTRTPSMS